MVKILSQASNLLTWFDEYDDDCPYEGLLQASYDNAGYHKTDSKNYDKTVSVEIFSSVALTSNYIPSNEPFFSRCIYIPINDKQFSEVQTQTVSELRKIETEGLSVISAEILSHRKEIEEHYLGNYKELRQSIKKEIGKEAINDRLIQNVSSILAFAYTLQIQGKICMCETTEREDMLAEFTEITVKQIKEQHRVMGERSDLQSFWDRIQNCFDRGQIEPEKHYRFFDNEIRIRFNRIYQIYRNSFKGQSFEKPVNLESIQTEQAVWCGVGEWKELLKSTKFKENISDSAFSQSSEKNTACFDYNKLKAGFDIDFKNSTKKTTI